MSLIGMVSELVDAGVRFVVIGGFAATAHGSAHLTDDVDICYDATAENVALLAAILLRWNAYPRGIEPGLPFIMDAKTLRGAPTLTLTTTHGFIDITDIVAGIGGYQKCLDNSQDIDVPPVRFRALTLPALIRAKRAAGRPKDLEHVVELEAIADTLRLRVDRR